MRNGNLREFLLGCSKSSVDAVQRAVYMLNIAQASM